MPQIGGNLVGAKQARSRDGGHLRLHVSNLTHFQWFANPRKRQGGGWSVAFGTGARLNDQPVALRTEGACPQKPAEPTRGCGRGGPPHGNRCGPRRMRTTWYRRSDGRPGGSAAGASRPTGRSPRRRVARVAPEPARAPRYAQGDGRFSLRMHAGVHELLR